MKKFDLLKNYFTHLTWCCLLLCFVNTKALAQGPTGVGFDTKIVGTEVKFTPYTFNIEEVLTYKWEFGDGSESTEEKPAHFYGSPGQYLVSLTITFNGPSGVLTKSAVDPILIADLGNALHEDRAFRKNSMNNLIPIIENDVFGAFQSVAILGGPFNGTQTIGTDPDTGHPAILYTPNTDYLGFDVIEYEVSHIDNDHKDTSYVYIDVYDKCGFEMSVTSHWSHCPDACDVNADGTGDQPFGQPAPDRCWGYTFDLFNVGDEVITSFHATIQIDEHMEFDQDVGFIEPASTIGDNLIIIEFDDVAKKISFTLADGATITSHERFQFSFLVHVLPDAPMPGRRYHTHFEGDVRCHDGTIKKFDQTIEDIEGGACDPNAISVSPLGCGDSGAIGSDTEFLTYTIDFQNYGVAPASRVIINDILPAGLDVTSIRIVDGEPFLPHLQILPAQNKVTFEFDDIFLPPISQDSSASTGYVKFKVDVDTTIAFGTSLNNFADIFFDSQLPVRTDTTITTFQDKPVPMFSLGDDVVDDNPADGFDCIPFDITLEGGSGQYQYEWETNGEDIGFNVSTLTICPLIYLYIDLTVTDTETGCQGHDRMYVLAEPEPEVVALPGDSCTIANDISALFGQTPNEPQTSSLWNNTNYTANNHTVTTPDCFFDNSIDNSIWYTFIGDGNRYRIKTVQCNAVNAVGGGDLQLAIYTGACGNTTEVGCSEDEDVNNEIYNANLEFDTEAGIEYRMLVDGTRSNTWNGQGEFCLEVTLLDPNNVVSIDETTIELFPNPTTGVLQWTAIDAQQVRVLDYTGRIIRTAYPINNQIDISTLAAGFYFLEIYDGKETYSAKVVKE